MRSVVFDSFAILAWFNAEPGARLTKALLADLKDGRRRGGICAVNLGEVYYTMRRRHGPERADELHRFLLALPWEVIPATNELVWAAARLKGTHLISYADAFALACAQQRDASLVTGDPELHAAPHGVEVLWETE